MRYYDAAHRNKSLLEPYGVKLKLSLFDVLFIRLLIHSTFGLLQLDTIWRIRLFRSSMLGMLSLLEESKLMLQIVKG